MMVLRVWPLKYWVEREKKIMCDLLYGIWRVVLMTLGLLIYLMKGSIVERNDEV